MLSFEYEMPAVGEPVLCLFLGNGITRGFCLGRYFYPGDPWPADGTGKDIYFKRLMKDATIKYDRTSKTYTLTAEEIVFNGNLTINGNLKVSGNTDIGGNTSIGGNMDVGGSATIGVDATIGGISFKTHVHGGVASGSSKTAIPQAG
jgi:Predicted acyltransferase